MNHVPSVPLQFVDLFSQVFLAYLLDERQYAGDAGTPLSFMLYTKTYVAFTLCQVLF